MRWLTATCVLPALFALAIWPTLLAIDSLTRYTANEEAILMDGVGVVATLVSGMPAIILLFLYLTSRDNRWKGMTVARAMSYAVSMMVLFCICLVLLAPSGRGILSAILPLSALLFVIAAWSGDKSRAFKS